MLACLELGKLASLGGSADSVNTQQRYTQSSISATVGALSSDQLAWIQ